MALAQVNAKIERLIDIYISCMRRLMSRDPADPPELFSAKRCSRCGEWKPIDEFPIKNRTTGLRRVWCRDCCRAYGREHYRRNRGAYIRRNRKRRITIRPRVKTLIDAYLREHPCVDCGCADITVLEFDHRDPAEKDWDVAVLARHAEWARVVREIQKCDVRCANCHRKRTAEQFDHARATGFEIDPSVTRPGKAGRYSILESPMQMRLFSSEPHGLRRCSRCRLLKPVSEFTLCDLVQARPSYYCRTCKAEHRRAHYRANRSDYIRRAITEARLKREDVLVRVFEYLHEHPCVDCGETDLRVLEFDHREGTSKTMEVSAMLGRRSWSKIAQEIEKCDVRCANCHRKKTARQQAWKVRLNEDRGRYRKMAAMRV